jgi:hypothetical protein
MDYRNIKGETDFLLSLAREAMANQGREDVSDDEILRRALTHQLRTLGVPASRYSQPPAQVGARN